MKTENSNYSPFWGLIAVFLTFTFLQSINLSNVLREKETLQNTQAELQKIVPQALTISQTIENLGRDLLSMTNQEARQIVADFKIAPSGPR